MSSSVNIAVVGAGFGQHVQVPAFRKHPACIIQALCSRRLERAQAAAQALGVPHATEDWRSLIGDPNIDALALAVPPPIQAEIALAAVRAGKHLFCEKPLAATAAQADEILAAARQAKVVHAVDFMFPEIAAWRKARELLQASTLGRLRQVVLNWRVETYSYGAGRQTTNWKKRLSDGGGTLNNFVSHTVYYLEWLFGAVDRVAGRLSPAGSDAEARVDGWLEFKGGFTGTVAVAADAFLGPGHRLEVYGDAGTLRLENGTADYARGFQLSVGTRAAGRLTPVNIAEDDDSTDGRVYPVSRVAGRFVDAILNGGSMTPSFSDGARAQLILDTLRLADRTGSWQTVPAG